MVTPEMELYWNSVFRLVFQHVCHVSQTVENLHLSPSSPHYLPRPQRQELGRSHHKLWHHLASQKGKTDQNCQVSGQILPSSMNMCWTAFGEAGDGHDLSTSRKHETCSTFPLIRSLNTRQMMKHDETCIILVLSQDAKFSMLVLVIVVVAVTVSMVTSQRGTSFTGVHRFTCTTCLHRRRSLHCWHVGDEFLMLKM